MDKGHAAQRRFAKAKAGRLWMLLGLLCWLVMLHPAKAHPHAWIDLQVRVLSDAQGQVTGLRQYWLLDPLYSMILLEEMREDAHGDTLQEKLNDIGGRMIRNLKDYAYFTEMALNGKPLAVRGIDNHRLNIERSRLQLGFDLLLAQPVTPTAQAPLHYQIYDPTYYIEILHEADTDAVSWDSARLHCQLQIKPPNPSPALVARAAALDINEISDPDLGKHFAEFVELRCE